MHEWGIACNIMEKVAAAARDGNLNRVRRVKIHLGTGLGIEKDEFLDCIRAITGRESCFNGCEFDIEVVDARLASIESIEGD